MWFRPLTSKIITIVLPTESSNQQELLAKVIVSHIEDPGDFYMQYSNDDHNLTMLMTQLAEHCDSDQTAIKFNSGELQL